MTVLAVVMTCLLRSLMTYKSHLLSYEYTNSITKYQLPWLRNVLGGQLHQFYAVGVE